MDLEAEKEKLKDNSEKLEEKIQKYETELSSQSILLKEKEQKIQLFESTQTKELELINQEREDKIRALDENLVQKEHEWKERILKLEHDLEERSQEVMDLSNDYETVSLELQKEKEEKNQLLLKAEGMNLIKFYLLINLLNQLTRYGTIFRKK